jgi:NhaP-type Na+/H+ or K+/H+ antiporter
VKNVLSTAVVFYSVFSTLFLYELNVGLGKDVDVADGFAIFFRMSLGGVVVGLVFSIALIFILYKLNRRLDGEEKVLQVASTVTVAYLTFYVSDVICHVSGVIGVVVLGTITKAFGGSFINDWQVMQSFWSLLEHLLNTVLFTLGGVEFGRVVASGDGLWEARDWGYLVALYILVSIIRFGSLIASYPLLVRIGLGTNWQETVFSGWAGLRGAVGITLALGLHSETLSATGDPQKTELTNKVFGMVAGVAFLTLLINGPLSGPLLVKLGLVDTSEARKRIIQAAEVAARRRILGDFLHLMTDPRFSFVDFALVRHHCPLLSNLTAEELEYAMRENKESVNPALYKQPKLNHVFPYIEGSARLRVAMERMMREAFMRGDLREQDAVFSSIDDIVNATNSVDDSTHVDGEAQVERNEPNPDLVKDIRIMFVELLRSAYHAQIQAGELDSREYHGFLAYVLLQSLDFAHDSAIAGVPLDDWRASQIASPELVEKVEDACHRIYNFCCFRKKVDSDLRKSKTTRLMTLRDERPLKYQLYRLDVLRAFSFIDAHMEAQDRLQEEFGKESGDLFLAFRTVLQESKSQIRKAGEILRTANKKQLKHVISHHLCLILQGKTARYYQLLHDSGILSAREAHHYLHEIDRQVISIRKCGLDKHPGSIDYADETHLVNEDSAHLLPRRRRKKQKSLL